MLIDLTVRDGTGRCRDVRVGAAGDATVAAVLGPLLAHLDPGHAAASDAHGTVLWCGARPIAADQPILTSGLRHGVVLSRSGPEPERPAPTALRLRVIGGPDAGRSRPLTEPLVRIGRGSDCELQVTDPSVSRQHARITLDATGVHLTDLQSTNGCAVDGTEVTAPTTSLRPGAVLRIGDTLCQLTQSAVPAADVRRRADGSIAVNRPPRRAGGGQIEPIELPLDVAGAGPQRVQWIAALVPALAGVALAYFLHAPQFLLFALLSPLIILTTALGDRIHWRRDRRRAARTFLERSARAARAVAVGLAAEQRLRREDHPDPTVLAELASTPGERLWERRRAAADLLEVRIGFADDSARLQTQCGPTRASAGLVRDVPVLVGLHTGPLGIAAPVEMASAVARWIITQLAVSVSPADLDFVALLSPDAQHRWQWMRWLPHLRPGSVAIADDLASMRTALARLGAGAAQRRAKVGASRDGWSGPWTVLVVDRAGELNELPELDELLRTGPAVGITAICLDTRANRLPAATSTLVTASGELGTRMLIRAAGKHLRGTEVVADQVSLGWAEQLARDLAPLVDSGGDGTSAIPRTCPLLELIGMPEPTATALARRWARSTGRPVATLGLGRDAPVRIDLVQHGPHALVAGTTGAGKSELLRSWVASLACDHPPEAVSFVLIDYKGGAAFADCAQLPHVVGLVTDLDAHLVRRALRSLRSELKRREELFAAAAAADLDAYRAGRPAQPLPRLILVVDEFAALVEELPEFVSGLIAVAQRGRSLGVHLILATQRPGRAVSAEIRANTALQIALRVTSAAESGDVIGAPDAAGIDVGNPGRAYLRTGSALTPFQVAHVGGPASPAVRANAVVVTALDPWRRDLSRPRGAVPSTGTDLAALAAAASRATESGRFRRQPSPWRPALPTLLPLGALGVAENGVAENGVAAGTDAVVIGLQDLPDRQVQNRCSLGLSGGSVLFVGGPRSGRTTSLLTLAHSALHTYGAADVHVHCIDCAGAGLAELAALPRLGTATTAADFDTVERLLDRLAEELARRSSAMARLRYGSVAEARAAGEQFPLLLLLLDGWEHFATAAEEHGAGRAIERLLGLLRSAPAHGLTVAITGDRAALAPRLAAAVETKFVLPLLDPADYALAAIPAGAVPRHRPPGRAIRTGDAVEVQIAHLGREPSRAAQRQALLALSAGPNCASTTPATGAREPIRIVPLPSTVTLRELPPAVTAEPDRRRPIRLGVGGDRAEPIHVDLFAGCARLLVAGPARSGRTTLLCNVLTQVATYEPGLSVVVAAPRRSPLAAQALELQTTKQASSGSTPQIVLLTQESELPAMPEGDVLLLVDDCESFNQTPLGDAVTAWLQRAQQGCAAVVTGRNDELAVAYRGIGAEMRQARCAVLLQPTALDGELAGVSLPRRRPTTITGRGLLIADPLRVAAAAVAATDLGPTPIQLALG